MAKKPVEHPKPKRTDIPLYPVNKRRFMKTLERFGSSIYKLGQDKNIPASSSTIKKQLDKGLMRKDILEAVAEHLFVKEWLFLTSVCFSSDKTVEKVQVELLKDYLTKQGKILEEKEA